ncbi:hypothetical protein Tco_0484791 [Tanacetum coccineum]
MGTMWCLCDPTPPGWCKTDDHSTDFGESLSEAWTHFKDLLQKVPHHGDLALYDNESWNDPRDFAKPVKEISLPQDVPSTSDRRLIKLENQVQRLMEAHLAPKSSIQVNKITSSCKICSGPHDTQYYMENPEQDFVDYASSRTDEAGGKWFTFKPEQNNIADTYNPSWKSHSNLSGPYDTQYCMEDPEQAIVEYASSRTDEAEDDQNKIDTVLKAITDRIADTLPSDTVKNPKLSTYPVFYARSYLTEYPQCSTQTYGSINAITIHTEQQSASYDDREKENKEEEDELENIYIHPPTPPDPSITFITEKVLKFNSFFESFGLVSLSSNTELICTKVEDGDVMFIEIVQKDDNFCKEEPKAGEQEVEYFDIFPTKSELAYHKKLDPRENANGGVSNFTGRIEGMHVFLGNFTYIVDFMIIEDISSIIDPRLSQVVIGKPFVEISNMTHDQPEGIVRFTNENNEVAYKMPHKIEQYDSLSNLEKEHTKSVYLRNEEDKRRRVKYVMSKILGFYKESLDLGPEYLTGMDDEGEVT